MLDVQEQEDQSESCCFVNLLGRRSLLSSSQDWEERGCFLPMARRQKVAQAISGLKHWLKIKLTDEYFTAVRSTKTCM